MWLLEKRQVVHCFLSALGLGYSVGPVGSLHVTMTIAGQGDPEVPGTALYEMGGKVATRSPFDWYRYTSPQDESHTMRNCTIAAVSPSCSPQA